jgi:redox-sensitive bicupin YhaK (pirin superfamily)
MIKVRKSTDRGTTKLDWLDSHHTFSFGNYYDPEYLGFGVLRVINEDKVNPMVGFDTHPHRDMEIITYVLEGALEHQDTLGTGSIIKPGDVQRMSAGTGIMHSEYNPLNDTPVHLLQIWIIPEKQNLPPSYEQKNFSQNRKSGKLTLLASHDGNEGSLTIHQDASLFVLDLDSGQTFTYVVAESRKVWVQIAQGNAGLNGQHLEQGDGAGIIQEKILEFQAKEKTEILIFDLPI